MLNPEKNVTIGDYCKYGKEQKEILIQNVSRFLRKKVQLDCWCNERGAKSSARREELGKASLLLGPLENCFLDP